MILSLSLHYLILIHKEKIVKKRKAYHRPAKSNEIYITRDKRSSVYIKRAVKLFNGGYIISMLIARV